MRESKVEDYLTRQVRMHGGLVRKMKWIGRHSATDQFIALFGIDYLVEVKRPGKEPEPAQEREHTRLRSAGCRVRTVSTFLEVDKFIQEAIAMEDKDIMDRLTHSQSIFESAVLKLINRLQEENTALRQAKTKAVFQDPKPGEPSCE